MAPVHSSSFYPWRSPPVRPEHPTWIISIIIMRSIIYHILLLFIQSDHNIHLGPAVEKAHYTEKGQEQKQEKEEGDF